MFTADQVVLELIRLQFFKFTPPSEMNYAVAALKRNFMMWSIIDTDDAAHHMVGNARAGSVLPPDRRIFLADAENLAEQGVCGFLNEISPVLQREGVSLQSLHDETQWDDQGRYIYNIWVNGVQHRIVNEQQGEKNAWCLAHKRTITTITALLKTAGSSEEAYGLASGNEAKIAILTRPLYNYIRTLPIKPYAIPMQTQEMNCHDNIDTSGLLTTVSLT